MNCETTKKNITAFLSGDMSVNVVDDFLHHISTCPECKKEWLVFDATWKALGAGPDTEPDPGYVQRFWLRLAQRTPWTETLWNSVRPFFVPERVGPWAVALAAALIILFVTFDQSRIRETENTLTRLDREQIIILDNFARLGAPDKPEGPQWQWYNDLPVEKQAQIRRLIKRWQKLSPQDRARLQQAR